MQVYAVLYSGKKNFLMGHKPDTGFFFHNSSGSGVIIQDGQKLNGGGKPALPGGKLEGSNIVKGAQKEFIEECGAKITFTDSALIIDKETYPLKGTTTWTEESVKPNYCVAFFKVDDEDLVQIAYIIQETNLLDLDKVVDNIKEEIITDYKSIGVRYPYCPADNELDSVAIWNLEADADKINALNNDKNKKDTGWFYEILKHLKNNILKV